MPSAEIREPDVLNAPGARTQVAKAVENLEADRAFIIASNTVATTTPVVKDLEEALGDAHVGTHRGIGQHAPADAIETAAAHAKRASVDLLVSCGGGSVIDATKFVAWALADQGAEPLLPHVAVPTTLSGAEFTLLAGRTVEGSQGRPVKTGMADPRIIPDVAILDPDACRFTPRWLWAATGIRAVDHACEGITSPQATPESDERCLRALELFAEHLPESVADAEELAAATQCLEAGREASAGINYAGSGAGLSHKLGKALGSTWDVPHGVTSALTLPAVMAFEAKRQPERAQLIADALGADTAEDGVLALIEAVGIQREPLGSYEVKETDVPWIVEYAIGKRDPQVEKLVLGLFDPS
ncbi:MAG: iron-containing alcohol dehydrogenase [Candidatus Thermoplasmatota archaeon]|nr:iron-containing alcohol dehydrogenase [Candidatus Thermoplasmatota archaeon]